MVQDLEDPTQQKHNAVIGHRQQCNDHQISKHFGQTKNKEQVRKEVNTGGRWITGEARLDTGHKNFSQLDS